MVDHYNADGAVTTEFFSQKNNTPVHPTEKSMVRRWRIRDGQLEIGSPTADGGFAIDGRPRRIEYDDNKRIRSIGGWVRTMESA